MSVTTGASVGRAGRREGSEPRREKWRPAQSDLTRWKEAYDLHEAGETYRAIGRRLGISGVMARVRCLRWRRWG